MVKRKKAAKAKRRKQQRGEGFFGDLWDGVKSGFNYVKDNKLISKLGGLIPDPRAQAVAKAAGSLGFGAQPHGNKGGVWAGYPKAGSTALPGVMTNARHLVVL